MTADRDDPLDTSGCRSFQLSADDRTDFDAARLLLEAGEIAEGSLEGIEDGARQLVELSGGDIAVISRARRVAAAQMEANPSALNKQIVSLIRRALEVGMDRWTMHETGPLP